MSQKKVDAYKARKGLHNKTDRKEKVLFGLEMFAWAFICVVIVAWIGYSAYVKVTGAKENVVQNTVMDTTALDNYISNLSTDASDGTDSLFVCLAIFILFSDIQFHSSRFVLIK